MRITTNAEYSRRLKTSMIGCGSHAQRNILPAFQYAPVDLTAVCDLNRDRAEAAARLFGARAVYADYHEMLSSECPEIVFVVLNADEKGKPRYPAVAMDVLRSGAHVWIEKPPASSASEIRRMREISRETGRQVGVGLKKMFFPAVAKAREITRQPEFGAVSSITARYPQSLPPSEQRNDSRKMAGFLDHIVHPYSVLLALGGPIDEIFVRRCERTGGSVTGIQFTSGAVGSLHLAAGQSGMSPLERVEVVGEGANVVVDNNIRVTYYRPGAPAGGYGRESSFFGEEEKAPLFWEPEFSLGQLYNKGLFLLGYAPEILHFCQRTLEGLPPELGSLDDALEILLVYEAYRLPDGQSHRISRG